MVRVHKPAGCSPQVCTDMNGQSEKPSVERSLGRWVNNSVCVPTWSRFHNILREDEISLKFMRERFLSGELSTDRSLHYITVISSRHTLSSYRYVISSEDEQLLFEYVISRDRLKFDVIDAALSYQHWLSEFENLLDVKKWHGLNYLLGYNTPVRCDMAVYKKSSPAHDSLRISWRHSIVLR